VFLEDCYKSLNLSVHLREHHFYPEFLLNLRVTLTYSSFCTENSGILTKHFENQGGVGTNLCRVKIAGLLEKFRYHTDSIPRDAASDTRHRP